MVCDKSVVYFILINYILSKKNITINATPKGKVQKENFFVKIYWITKCTTTDFTLPLFPSLPKQVGARKGE